ncbi:MAG: hypothetical protein OHK0046_11190 [Anaerolineae bacterium]
MAARITRLAFLLTVVLGAVCGVAVLLRLPTDIIVYSQFTDISGTLSTDIMLTDVTRRLHLPLLASTENEQWPVWSPDGRKLAFIRSATGGRWRVYQWVVGAAAPELLSHNYFDSDHYAVRYDILGWSEDSSTLFFVQNAGGQFTYYRAGAGAVIPVSVDDPGLQTYLTSLTEQTPDTVTYDSQEGLWYLMNFAGTERILPLTQAEANNALAWSPDQRHVAVTLIRNQQADLYVVDAESGVVRRLTTNGGMTPAWQPGH